MIKATSKPIKHYVLPEKTSLEDGDIYLLCQKGESKVWLINGDNQIEVGVRRKGLNKLGFRLYI